MASSKTSKPNTKKTAKVTIALSGLAGSGKSTVAKLLAKKFRVPQVSAGDIYRAMAKEHEMDIIEMGRYAESHPDIDKEIDERLMKRAREGGVVLDGRAVGYLTKKRRIPAIRVFLAVKPETVAERISKRDKQTAKRALATSRKREKENAKRLRALWGLDIYDLSYYDVVIQTDNYTPKEIVDIISQLVRYDRT